MQHREWTRRICAVLILAAVASLGCGGGDKLSGLNLPTNIVGTWTLKTVNGVAPPGVVQAGNPQIELLSDSYTFNVNGSYTETGTIRTTSNGSVTTDPNAENGAWLLTSKSVTLYPVGAAPYAAAWTTTSLTLTFGTVVLVYAQ